MVLVYSYWTISCMHYLTKKQAKVDGFHLTKREIIKPFLPTAFLLGVPGRAQLPVVFRHLPLRFPRHLIVIIRVAGTHVNRRHPASRERARCWRCNRHRARHCGRPRHGPTVGAHRIGIISHFNAGSVRTPVRLGRRCVMSAAARPEYNDEHNQEHEPTCTDANDDAQPQRGVRIKHIPAVPGYGDTIVVASTGHATTVTVLVATRRPRRGPTTGRSRGRARRGRSARAAIAAADPALVIGLAAAALVITPAQLGRPSTHARAVIGLRRTALVITPTQDRRPAADTSAVVHFAAAHHPVAAQASHAVPTTRTARVNLFAAVGNTVAAVAAFAIPRTDFAHILGLR